MNLQRNNLIPFFDWLCAQQGELSPEEMVQAIEALPYEGLTPDLYERLVAYRHRSRTMRVSVCRWYLRLLARKNPHRQDGD